MNLRLLKRNLKENIPAGQSTSVHNHWVESLLPVLKDLMSAGVDRQLSWETRGAIYKKVPNTKEITRLMKKQKIRSLAGVANNADIQRRTAVAKV